MEPGGAVSTTGYRGAAGAVPTIIVMVTDGSSIFNTALEAELRQPVWAGSQTMYKQASNLVSTLLSMCFGFLGFPRTVCALTASCMDP